MDKRETITENKEETEKALKQKTNQDFNGKKPLPNDPDLKKEKPEPEVPGIEDKKKNSTSGVDEKQKTKGSSEEYKPEQPDTTDKPLNEKPDETVAGDSDAPTILNKQDDGKVF